MFQFLGDIVWWLLMAAFGAFAFFRPYHLVGTDGSLEQIEKRARTMKRLGAALVIGGLVIVIGTTVQFFMNR